MPIEQMNISLSPKMARFIRGKVKAGDYTNASQVVRDAVRHMQDDDAARKSRGPAYPGTPASDERENLKQSVQRGIKDFEEGRYKEFDEAGLRRHFEDIGKRARSGSRQQVLSGHGHKPDEAFRPYRCRGKRSG